MAINGFYSKYNSLRKFTTTHFFDKIDNLLSLIERPFTAFVIGVHVLYVIIIIGLFSYNRIFIETFNNYVNWGIQIFICFYLIIRFNPFRYSKLYKYDTVIIFWAAVFLLFNLGTIKFLQTEFFKFSLVKQTANNTGREITEILSSVHSAEKNNNPIQHVNDNPKEPPVDTNNIPTHLYR